MVPPPADIEEEKGEKFEEFPEGRIVTKLHTRRERNPTLIKKKKESVLKSTGSLKCEVCGFDFEYFYGSLGTGFAECHHCLPLSSLANPTKTKLDDLAVVCANCHRILHRARPWATTQQLKELLLQRASV